MRFRFVQLTVKPAIMPKTRHLPATKMVTPYVLGNSDGTIVFVEVKTRSNRYQEPETAVDLKKQRNLLFSINHYLKCHRIHTPHRFDVITVVGTMGCEHPEIEHIEDFRLYVPQGSTGRRWR